MTAAMWISICLMISALPSGVFSQDRSLQQAYATAPSSKSIPPRRPVSATTADLQNDPAGIAHLLAALGNQQQLVSQYVYTDFEGNYNVDPTYDPLADQNQDASVNGSYRVVGNSGAIAVHALPLPNGLVLFMDRTSNQNSTGPNPYLSAANGTQQEVGAFYNMTSNTFVPFHIAEHPFCSAHTLLPDGQAFVLGGDNINLNAPWLTVGFQALRIINGSSQSYVLGDTMPTARWYPSVVTLSDGNALIVGGMQQEAGGWAADQLPSDTSHPVVKCSGNAGGSLSDPGYDNPTFQLFNSTSHQLIGPQLALSILLETWPVNSYPFLTLLPSGSVLIIAGQQMEALYFTPTGAIADSAVGDLPDLTLPVSYPQYASLALLPLQPPLYETQVLMAGGSDAICANSKTPGSTNSYLVDVTPGANHSVVTEELNFPRNMGDLVLLPDGRGFLCNGAQIGIAGSTTAGVGNAGATNGTTVAEIYDPSKPIGQRWSPVGDSKIWRLYHSIAFLTPNAEVFIAGSEATSERRVQLYSPDYLNNGKPRPVITSAPSTMAYATNYTIQFSNVSSVDRVVLNRLTGATHGNHFDNRQVVLACSGGSSQTNCASPPNSSIAPPGYYMLFALSGGVPSYAPYVSLQAPPGSAPAPSSPLAQAAG